MKFSIRKSSNLFTLNYYSKIKQYKSFTLIEVMLVIVMISFGLIWLLMSLSYGSSSLEKIRKEVIAINIAREGMEAVYNIRDTNWTRWSGRTSYCWLKANPLVDEGTSGCENDPWLTWSNYILSGESMSWQQYFRLIADSSTLSLKDWISSQDNQYIMCMNNNLWYNCPGGTWYIKEWKFFRMIKWINLIDKNTDSILNCTDWSSSSCSDDSAKEYRFCSSVEYQWSTLGKVELCGVITNFK